ncbi:hypothetical protein [Calycomorphotria hydatis]|uniref:hypothetical protein n=1 Tax=Calycomorphotria hydatis TaxID=2528027 RepID=UPI0036F23700
MVAALLLLFCGFFLGRLLFGCFLLHRLFDGFLCSFLLHRLFDGLLCCFFLHRLFDSFLCSLLLSCSFLLSHHMSSINGLLGDNRCRWLRALKATGLPFGKPFPKVVES